MRSINVNIYNWYNIYSGIKCKRDYEPHLIIFTEQLILQIQEIDYRLIQYVEYINIHKM